MRIEAIPAATPSLSTPSLSMPSMQKSFTLKTAEQAAQQFESLLIAQMLRSARESGASEDEEGESESSAMLDLSDQQFAQMLAQKGGLNLSHLIVDGLKKDQAQATRNATGDVGPGGKAR
jgi:Rod binding domain-containing protein